MKKEIKKMLLCIVTLFFLSDIISKGARGKNRKTSGKKRSSKKTLRTSTKKKLNKNRASKKMLKRGVRKTNTYKNVSTENQNPTLADIKRIYEAEDMKYLLIALSTFANEQLAEKNKKMKSASERLNSFVSSDAVSRIAENSMINALIYDLDTLIKAIDLTEKDIEEFITSHKDVHLYILSESKLSDQELSELLSKKIESLRKETSIEKKKTAWTTFCFFAAADKGPARDAMNHFAKIAGVTIEYPNLAGKGNLLSFRSIPTLVIGGTALATAVYFGIVKKDEINSYFGSFKEKTKNAVDRAKKWLFGEKRSRITEPSPDAEVNDASPNAEDVSYSKNDFDDLEYESSRELSQDIGGSLAESIKDIDEAHPYLKGALGAGAVVLGGYGLYKNKDAIGESAKKGLTYAKEVPGKIKGSWGRLKERASAKKDDLASKGWLGKKRKEAALQRKEKEAAMERLAQYRDKVNRQYVVDDFGNVTRHLKNKDSNFVKQKAKKENEQAISDMMNEGGMSYPPYKG